MWNAGTPESVLTESSVQRENSEKGAGRHTHVLMSTSSSSLTFSGSCLRQIICGIVYR